MNGRFLLTCLGLSTCLFTLWQTPMEIVSAEVEESVPSTSQQETTLSTAVNVSSSTAQDLTKSTMTSSVETSKSSPSAGSAITTISSSESKEAVEESSVSTSSVSETTVDKLQPTVPLKKVEENYQFSVSKNVTTKMFIQTIAQDAQQIAWEEELYASVMIAQAILETGSGNSQLARPPYHNLFGIKGSYQGKQVSFKTQEDKGNGVLYTIQSTFRQYSSYKESLKDYAALLKNGLSSNTDFYQGTWKSNAATYQEAAKSLTGKYATDTSYDKKLIALIETYELTIYDNDPDTITEVEQKQPMNDPIKPENNSEEKRTVEVSNENREQSIIVSETTQTAVMIPPTAQRPAKQLQGNRSVQ